MSLKKIQTIDPIDPIDYSVASKKTEFSKYVTDAKSATGNAYLFGDLNNFPTDLQNVITRIQTSTYSFTKKDEKELESFTANINKHFNCSQRISSFKSFNALPNLFNAIKKTTGDYSSFKKTLKLKLGRAQKSGLPGLFSIVKNFQDSDKYPIGYPFWKNLISVYKFDSLKSIKDNYDKLCTLYNTCGILPKETPKHIYFGAYMDQLAINLANKLAPIITSFDPQDIGNIFNITEYDNILGITRGAKNIVILPTTPRLAPAPNYYLPHSLNLILYGPPGTGKTYNTLFHALAIIEGKKVEDIENECKEFDKLHNDDPKTNPDDGYKKIKENYHYDDLVKKGQIVFTTFHQSMSYEDFIEGIKPDVDSNNKIKAIHNNENSASSDPQFGNGTTTIENLSRMKYVVKDGIFKEMCDLKSFLKYAKAKKIVFTLESGGEFIVDEIEEKSVSCSDLNGNVVANENLDELIDSLKKELESKQEEESVTIQEEDPKKELDKKPNPNREQQEHPCRKGIIRKFLEKRVLIIDEINRGNVAQIFGELITLIEDNKRLGNSESMTATLPYSQDKFGVPNNLYIIGTMNTADRSVEALDTALRRRFSFEEMMPDPELLKDDKDQYIEVCGVKLSELLKTINDRIVALKDREHQIGHSYFMWSKEPTNKEKWLAKVFKDKIIPLLQEYFYGDYKKIYYVLGGSKKDREGFVRIDSVKKSDIFAVKIDEDYDYEIPETRYEIQTIDEKNIQKAIDIMMKKVTQ